MYRLYALLVFLALGQVGCAGLLDRPEESIRRGDDPVEVFDATVSTTPEMDDGGLPPGDDETSTLPDRRIWVLVRSEAWHQGLRARLDPPHQPMDGRDVLDEHPDWPVLVHWVGPDSPGTARITAFREAGRRVGVWYDLRQRAAGSPRPRADIVADMSWLAAHFLPTEAALREEDRPVLVVAMDGEHGPLAAAARARLDVLGMPVFWVEQIDPTEPVAIPPADAIVPSCSWSDDRVRASWRQAARNAGVRWIPCASPPTNPRLDHPTDPVEARGPGTFSATIVHARRTADLGGHLILVDGVGGWRDDRQIDPVTGDMTTRPTALTDDIPYAPYGMERVRAVETLLEPAGAQPEQLDALLIEILRLGGVTVSRLERGTQGFSLELSDPTGTGHYELLLHDRPFIVEEGCVLHYGRTHGRLFVDLVTDQGHRLGAPPAGDEVFVAIDLAPLVGARVEEVLLVYDGGVRQLRGDLAGLRIDCSSDGNARAL